MSLNLVSTLELLGELFKIMIPRPYFRPFKSESLGWKSSIKYSPGNSNMYPRLKTTQKEKQKMEEELYETGQWEMWSFGRTIWWLIEWMVGWREGRHGSWCDLGFRHKLERMWNSHFQSTGEEHGCRDLYWSLTWACSEPSLAGKIYLSASFPLHWHFRSLCWPLLLPAWGGFHSCPAASPEMAVHVLCGCQGGRQ